MAVGHAVTDRELVVDNEEHDVAVRHRVTGDEAVCVAEVEEHTELDKLLVPEIVFVAEGQLEEDAEEHWLTVEEWDLEGLAVNELDKESAALAVEQTEDD